MNNKLKIALLYFYAIILFQSCKNVLSITNGNTDKPYYQVNDSIKLKIHSLKKLNNCGLDIYNTEGVIISHILFEVTSQKNPSHFAYENNSKHLYTLSGLVQEMEFGTYLLNNEIPFLVGDEKIDKDIVIDGYTDKFSYQENDTFKLFVNSKTAINNYILKINDINGKLVKSILCDISPQKKPDEFAYEKGFGYQLTLKSLMPNLKSGIYLFDNKIPFLVRSKKQPEILVVYSSNTENAYSKSGGKSLYSYDPIAKKHTPIVSFLRPIGLPSHSTDFLRWINTQKAYSIGYICDKDLDNYENIKGAKLLIIPGHNEYWTRMARRNFDRFVDEGSNSLILSGNTMWWQVRYNDEKNQLICYKNKEYDSAVDSLKTVTWPEALVNYPIINSIGLDFNHGGYGLKDDNGWDGFKIVNPRSPLLKGTGLKYNDILKLPTDEYDGTLLEFSNDSTKVELKNKSLFHKSELIGYDFGFRFHTTIGTWIVIQHKASSGVIINTASTDWCSKTGMLGKSSHIIKKITLNMIDLLLQNNKEKIFTTKPKLH